MSVYTFSDIEQVNIDSITNVDTDYFLFYSCSNVFAKYACVSFSSIILNKPKDKKVNFVIFTSNISETNMQKISNYYRNIANDVNFIFVFVKDNFCMSDEGKKVYMFETFFRFNCFHKKFRNVKKSIYIDSDTVITNSTLLFDAIDTYTEKLVQSKVPLGVVADIGAVQSVSNFASNFAYAVDKKIYDVNRQKILIEDWWKIGLNLDISKIFNAGVMIINQQEISKKSDNYYFETMMNMAKKEKYFFFDQDILNKVFHGNVLYLPMQMNYAPTYDWNQLLDSKFDQFTRATYHYSEEEIICAQKNPLIIHFFWGNKPWDRTWNKNNVATKYYLINMKNNPFSKQHKRNYLINNLINSSYSKMIWIYKKIK